MGQGERKIRRWQLQPTERQMILILGDIIVAMIAMLAAMFLWARPDWLEFGLEFIQARAGWFVLLPIIWPLFMINLYDIRRAGSWRETVRGVILAAVVGLIVYLVFYFFRFEPGSLPRRGPLYFLSIAVVLTLGWRRTYIWIFTRPLFRRRMLIVGAGQSGADLLHVLRGLPSSPFYVVGLIDDDPGKAGMAIEGIPVLGSHRSLLALAAEEEVSGIVVAITGAMKGAMFQAILDAQERGVEIIRMPVLYEELLNRVPIHHLESDWLLRSFVDEVRVSRMYLILKRLMDLVGASVGLLAFALVFPWVGLAIVLESGKPILFTQRRLGKGGKPFDIVKFRTMWQDAEADGHAKWTQAGDPRMTRVGRILRKMHIDEFPQFISVFKGSMSLVGPRPERPELVSRLEKEIPFYRARLLAKPGIGGWAQVRYGKGASIEGSAEKLEYDLYYIKHRSLFLDVWIILLSAFSMFGFQGV